MQNFLYRLDHWVGESETYISNYSKLSTMAEDIKRKKIEIAGFGFDKPYAIRALTSEEFEEFSKLMEERP